MRRNPFFGPVTIALAFMVGIGIGYGLIQAVPARSQEPVTQVLDILLGEGEIIREVEGKDILDGEFHRWEPDTLVVRKGDWVVLNVKNPRKNVHSLVIPAYGVDTGPLAGRTGEARVEFLAYDAGVYPILCGIDFVEGAGLCDPDHKRMVGYLIVLERGR